MRNMSIATIGLLTVLLTPHPTTSADAGGGEGGVPTAMGASEIARINEQLLTGDLRTHRLVKQEDGSFKVLVEPGSKEESETYYAGVDKALIGDHRIPICRQQTLETLKAFFEYLGYRDLEPAEVDRQSTATLMSRFPREVLATVFFAPKIVNVNVPPKDLTYGWRKLLRLNARQGSCAKTAGLESAFLLYNYVTDVPTFEARKRVAAIQVLLVRAAAPASLEKSAPDYPNLPVYFFVYNTDSGPNPYQRGFALNASFDAATPPPDKDYFVPRACAQCHGATGRGSDMEKSKVNYLDTDHWFDRVQKGDDFEAMKVSDVLPDGGAPPVRVGSECRQGSARFEAAFRVYRTLNQEIEAQNARVPEPGFQLAAVRKWLAIHDRCSAHISPFDRSLPGTETWNAQEAPDKDLLPLMNRYCFRCHSSFEYHVFDKPIVKRLAEGGSIQGVIEDKLMPQDRNLTDSEIEKLVELLDQLGGSPAGKTN